MCESGASRNMMFREAFGVLEVWHQIRWHYMPESSVDFVALAVLA